MLTYGFYNSVGGDRKYDAEQIGAMFNGLITDGVFANYKNALKVTPGTGKRELVISSGRAWFNGTWTSVDDAGHSIYVMGSVVETTYFVYLAVDKANRRNSIAWYSSVQDNKPEKSLYFYLLAQVTIPGGVNTIEQSMITDTRGSNMCPYVTGILETVSFEEVVKEVCGENWQTWLDAYSAGLNDGLAAASAKADEALETAKEAKAYVFDNEDPEYTWAKYTAVETGSGSFEWGIDKSVSESDTAPPSRILFRTISITGSTAVLANPPVTHRDTPLTADEQLSKWGQYRFFYGDGAYGQTDGTIYRYDALSKKTTGVGVGGSTISRDVYSYTVFKFIPIEAAKEPGEYLGTVTADTASAYPRNGYKDGYWYTRFAAKAEDVSFYYPGLSAKNVKDAIIEVVETGGNGPGTAMSVIEVEELPSIGAKGALYIVKKPGDSDASEYLWLDRWEKIGCTNSGENLTLDTTLTQSGKAADAKAVGDALDELENKIPSIEGLAKTEDIPSKPEDIGAQPQGNYLTEAPVESVNGKTGAVVLGAADVGARPDTWVPTAQEVGALPDTYKPPDQTADQVGADPKGTAASAVSAHNADGEAHNDLRLAVQKLQAAVDAFLDVDDTTRDELSEVLALIDANADVIESITTSKVSVADIVDNLTTNVANRPLSAAQGVAIKTLIDGLSSGKLDASKLQEAINTALAQAKANGEFDGADGVSPTVAVSAITGGHRVSITDESGTKTVDVMDGKDGNPGDPGRGIKSITRTAGNGAAGTTDTYTITYTDDTTSTYNVYNGKDGTNGTPGTSVTVESVTESTADGGNNVVEFSDGKTLTVKNGKAGTPGKDGDNYVLTDADKTEIAAKVPMVRVAEQPTFVNDVSECTDTSKVYVLPDGYLYAYLPSSGPSYTNLAGTITYDKRLSSSGKESSSAMAGAAYTDFIPVKQGQTVRIKNFDIYSDFSSSAFPYVCFYTGASEDNAVSSTPYIKPSIMANEFANVANAVNGDVVTWTAFNVGDGSQHSLASSITHIRISGKYFTDKEIIVTVDEEITEDTGGGYAWQNTGHAFVPADYEDRIVELEEQVEVIKAGLEDVTPADYSGNILYGKKWVSCGDSFTANGYNASDGFDESVYIYQDGRFAGKNIVYPYIIGLRNNMDIVNLAAGGQTMAASSNSFMSVYQNIPDDADYITIMLGINDKVQGLTVGTLEDSTDSTFCGAYNIAMEYILENHPFAHIGIMVSNGTNAEIMAATRGIAERWGVPYLDYGSPQVPLMNRYTGRNVCAKAQEIREKNFCVISDGTTATNGHPNTAAHEYESTFIEAWLRTL